jgi:hypothetical protein
MRHLSPLLMCMPTSDSPVESFGAIQRCYHLGKQGKSLAPVCPFYGTANPLNAGGLVGNYSHRLTLLASIYARLYAMRGKTQWTPRPPYAVAPAPVSSFVSSANCRRKEAETVEASSLGRKESRNASQASLASLYAKYSFNSCWSGLMSFL